MSAVRRERLPPKSAEPDFYQNRNQFDEFLDRIFTELDVEISVKTRIGIEDPEEF